MEGHRVMSGWVSRNRSYLVRLLRVVPSPRYISHCLLRSPLHVLAHPFLGSPLPGRLALLACECFVLGTFGRMPGIVREMDVYGVTLRLVAEAAKVLDPVTWSGLTRVTPRLPPGTLNN